MTIIKPITAQDIRQREFLQDAVEKAKLNLSEVLALNERYGTKLEYVPKKDIIELSIYNDTNAPRASKEFAAWCNDCAEMLSQKFKDSKIQTQIFGNEKNTLGSNLHNALKKLRAATK